MPFPSGPSGPVVLPARALRPWFQPAFNEPEGLKGRPFNPPHRIRRIQIPAAGQLVGTRSEVSLFCDGRCPRIAGTLASINECFLFAGTDGLSGLRKFQDAPVSRAEGPGWRNSRPAWAERTSGNTHPYRKSELYRYLCSKTVTPDSNFFDQGDGPGIEQAQSRNRVQWSIGGPESASFARMQKSRFARMQEPGRACAGLPAPQGAGKSSKRTCNAVLRTNGGPTNAKPTHSCAGWVHPGGLHMHKSMHQRRTFDNDRAFLRMQESSRSCTGWLLRRVP